MSCENMDGVVFPAGSRWREVETGRVVTVIGPGPNSPWLRYEGDPPEKTFYCCIEDFTVWGRFVPIPEADPNPNRDGAA